MFLFQGLKHAARYLIRSRSQNLWVFQPDLVKIYKGRDNAPYRSVIHRIERYQYEARDPDATLIAFRVLHVREQC